MLQTKITVIPKILTNNSKRSAEVHYVPLPIFITEILIILYKNLIQNL